METLENKMQKSIKELEEVFGENTEVKKFENSIKEFELMVERGVAKKRGNHLLPSGEAHLRRNIGFNNT